MRIITVVRGIIRLEDKLLLAQNKSLAAMDAWCLPGGKVDDDEPLQGALVRELREETGVEAHLGQLAYINQFMTRKDGELVQRLEFFFHVTNPSDFEQIDINSTTHGALETEKIEFVRYKTVKLLPTFLAKETLDFTTQASMPVKFFSTSDEPK